MTRVPCPVATGSGTGRSRKEAVFRVSYHLIDSWLPLLGPVSGWLVVGLQQACWQAGRRRPCGCISQLQLGYLAGISREQVNRRLNDKQGLVNWFVNRVDRAPPEANSAYGVNRYYLDLEEPLTPIQQAGLHTYLVQAAKQFTLEQTLEYMASQEREWLLAELARLGRSGPPANKPQSIADIAGQVWELGPDERAAVPGGPVARLSQLLLRPDLAVVGNQGFRRLWVPALGPVLGWLVVLSRRATFYNPATGETRAEFCFAKARLAAGLGLDWRTIQRQLVPHLQSGRLRASSPLAEFLTELRLGYRTVEGRIRTGSEVWQPDAKDRANHINATPPATPSRPKFTPRPAATGPRRTTGIARSGQGDTLSQHPYPADKTEQSDFQHRRPGNNLRPEDQNGDADCRRLWQQLLEDLRLQTSGPVFDSWLRPTQALRREGKRLVVGVPSQRAREVLEKRLANLIRRGLDTLPGGPDLEPVFELLPGREDGEYDR